MIVSKIIPLAAFVLLGVLCRSRGFIKRDTIEGLKWLIVNILLPGVLFTSFLFARIELSLLLVAAAVFASNLLMFGAGKLASPLLKNGRRYIQFLSGGMEYGMLGLALFSSLYGVKGVEYISLVDLGHELFFWFFLAPLFQAREGGKRGIQIKSFLLSPINIAIISGIVINLAGGSIFFTETAFGMGISSLCGMMGQAIGPLILIVIGYGLTVVPEGLKDVLVTCCVRAALAIGTAYCVGNLLIRQALGWSEGYVAATWILFMTAPSFSIPVFARPGDRKEEAYITSTIAVYTILTFIATFIVVSKVPAL